MLLGNFAPCHGSKFGPSATVCVMKIKCPGCSTVLNIPDSAAGKVVKCPSCSKQLRAPGGSAAAPKPAAPQRPAPQQRPATPQQRPAQQRPAAQRPQSPSAAAAGLDPDMFDELTENDLQPVSAVPRPGQASPNPYASPGAGGASKTDAMLKQYASEDVRTTGDEDAKGPRPGLLIFLGIMNILWALGFFGVSLLLIGLVGMIPALGEEIPEAEGTMLAIVIAAALAMGALSAATAVACFLNKSFCWYIMLFSYAYGFADRVFGAIGSFQDEEGGARIGGAVVGIVVGLSFWAFMHSDEVKAYYGTTRSGLGGMIVANILGLVIGGALGAAVVFVEF